MTKTNNNLDNAFNNLAELAKELNISEDQTLTLLERHDMNDRINSMNPAINKRIVLTAIELSGLKAEAKNVKSKSNVKKKDVNLTNFTSQQALADYLQVSRQTVINRLKANKLKGKLDFTQSEMELLQGQPKQSKRSKSKVKSNVNVEVKAFDTLQAQLTEKDKQIAQLLKQLDQAQQLQLDLQSQLKNLPAPKQKLGFWSRLFGQSDD